MSRALSLAQLDGSARSNPDAIPVPPGRRLRSLILPALLVFAAAALLLLTAGQALRPHADVDVAAVIVRGMPAPPPSPPPPGTAQTASGSAVLGSRGAGANVVAAGWLEAEPFVRAVTALTPGIIKEIIVLEGDPVRRDEIVARLVDDDAQLALARADAALLQRKAAVELAEADLAAANVQFAEPVDLTLRVATARAALADAEAAIVQHPALLSVHRVTLEQLEDEAARQQRARETEAASAIELVRAQRAVESARATYDVTAAERPMLEARRQAAEAQLHAAEHTLALRVDDTLRLSRAKAMVALARAEAAEAEAARDDAMLQLQRMTVRAGTDGIMQRRLRKPGDIVGPHMDDPHGAHIAYVYDPKSLQARVDVPLADARHVRVGGTVEIVAEVLPQRTFIGTVIRVTHEADLQKNTLQVKVRIDEPDPVLRPEMLVRARFLPAAATATAGGAGGAAVAAGATAREGEGLFVPQRVADAVREGRVYVVADRRGRRGVAESRAVELGRAGPDGWHEVNRGLQPGDLVIVAAAATMSDGRRVRIADAAAAAEELR